MSVIPSSPNVADATVPAPPFGASPPLAPLPPPPELPIVAIRKAGLDYAERNDLKLFAIDPNTRNGSFYNGHGDRATWEADFARGMQLGVSAINSDLLLTDTDVYGAEDRAEARQHYEMFCGWFHLSDAQGNVPEPYGNSKSGGWHSAFRVPPGFKDVLRKGHHKFKISDFRDLKPGEKDREQISVRWRALNVYAGSQANGGVYRLADNAPPPHPYGPNTAGLFEWFTGLTIGQKAVTTAPENTDECTQSEAECAKLERFVREVMLKDPRWFEDRDRRRETTWGIKRKGFGHRGYAIAQILCDATEDRKGGRLDRYWDDPGANKGTLTLDSFWKHCANLGIKQTPAEIGEWRGKEFMDNIKGLGAGAGMPAAAAAPSRDIQITDFVAHAPDHSYFYMPTGKKWTAAGIDSVFPQVSVDPLDPKKKMLTSKWISRTQRVDCLTWYPGVPQIVDGKHFLKSGWVTAPGRTLNLFQRGPILPPPPWNDPIAWLKHVHYLYPDEADHIIKWLAFAVQNPGQKINHALGLFGPQRIGKDSFLVPVRFAVGAWNFAETTPQRIFGEWTGHMASVICRVNEAHDLGDVNRFALYEKMKTMTAAPPETCNINGKYQSEYEVPNVTNVLITSNHKSGGIYLPADDERYFIAWSPRNRSDFSEDYFRKFYAWLDNGGTEAVAAYLRFAVDVSGWDHKLPPPKTSAWREIVSANLAPEDGDWSDALEKLEHPPVVTLRQVKFAAPTLVDWIGKNGKRIQHRFEQAGYHKVHNTGTKDGRWKINGQNEAVYGRKDLTFTQHAAAITALAVPPPPALPSNAPMPPQSA